jgi:hypothetical protein
MRSSILGKDKNLGEEAVGFALYGAGAGLDFGQRAEACRFVELA